MSQTTEKLAAAVDAIVNRLEELATENANLKAQLATYADLEDKAAALEVAAAADAAAEQDATDRLAAAIAAVAATRAG